MKNINISYAFIMVIMMMLNVDNLFSQATGDSTTIPLMSFHVEDGGILSTGVQGTNTVTGAGNRLMWILDRAAFRERPYIISSDSKHQELQSFTLNYVGCTFNHYFHLPDFRIGHPPQTERSTWNIKMPNPCS